MTIKVGDTVEIAKGVEVFEGYTHGTMQHFDYLEKKISARKSKVVVETIIEVTRWWTLLNKDEHEEITKRSGIYSHWLFDSARGLYNDDMGPIVYTPGDRNGSRMTASAVDDWLVKDKKRVPIERQPEIDALFVEFEARVRERFGDLKFIDWSKGQKSTLLSNAVAVAPKADRAPKEATITKRRLMVPGSVWRFTEEVEINVWVSNPEIDRLIKERDSYRVNQNSQHRRGGTMVVVLGGGRQQTQGELDAMARIQKQINETPSKIKIKAAVVPAGVRVKIADKLAAGYKSYNDKETNGLLAPMIILEGKIGVTEQLLKSGNRYDNPLHYANGISLPYSQIESAIEAESIPESIVWTLRDTATGEYFGGWESETKNGYSRQTNTPKMSKTFSGAKKYKNLAAVKASIMDFTGYHDGIEIEGYVGEWVGNGSKKIDLPATWEAVAVDKTTNADKETRDVQDWFKDLMRLRDITKNVNGAVRGLYKKLEAQITDYPAFVSFEFDPSIHDIDDDKIAPSDRALINEAMEANSEEKAPSHKTPLTQAFAVKSQSDATLIVLAYQGQGSCKAYNSHDLTEIVTAK